MSLLQTANDYAGLVAQLNADWRVVECPGRAEWILQRRGSPKMSRRGDWRGRSYCRTREALIRCTREYVGTVDPGVIAILIALPERIEVDQQESLRSRPRNRGAGSRTTRNAHQL